MVRGEMAAAWLGLMLDSSRQLVGEQLCAQVDRGAHETLTTDGGPVAPTARQFAQKTMRAQQADPTTDTSALSTTLHQVGRLGAEQPLPQFLIAKTTHRVLATEHAQKQSLIVPA